MKTILEEDRKISFKLYSSVDSGCSLFDKISNDQRQDNNDKYSGWGTRKGEVCNFNPLYPPENQYENCPYEPYAVNGTDRHSRYCRPNVLCNFDRMGKERPITQEHG